MGKVFTGRYTASGDEDVTVFLIGMRFNQPWRIDRAWPVFTAMPKMLIHLGKTAYPGLLGYEMWFGRTTNLVMYWRSPEELQAFAADPEAPHLKPWRRFMKESKEHPAVGIWHETYRVPAQDREAVYVNMPEFGLAKATRHVPVAPGLSTAKARMRSA